MSLSVRGAGGRGGSFALSGLQVSHTLLFMTTLKNMSPGLSLPYRPTLPFTLDPCTRPHTLFTEHSSVPSLPGGEHSPPSKAAAIFLRTAAQACKRPLDSRLWMAEIPSEKEGVGRDCTLT